MVPYHEGMECDANSYEEVRLDIEGITNGEQINSTVVPVGQQGDRKVVIKEEFVNYGKATLHFLSDKMNIVASLIAPDLIFVKAKADLEMSYSLGSAAIDNAILTDNQNAAVYIFFGNTKTKLIAQGPKVLGISKVVGGTKAEYNQEDGSVIVTLPSISKETTTKVTLTIDLEGGKTVTRTLSIVRTAITLGFNRAAGDATLQAGYVFNKAYLYNNKDHNDAIFDAYLQIILYKDGVVAGYRQIQINDKEIINKLEDNESGSIELLSDNCINLYGKRLNDTIEGVNSASVFLTNGPIDFNSDKLPSIKFGIGSGVSVEWGNN